jgi:hypothetical protein
MAGDGGTRQDAGGAPVTGVQARMAALSELIRSRRYVYASEVELHAQLEQVMLDARLPVLRELRLSSRDRIDFLIGDVGIEVKVKGERTPLRQLTRYAGYSTVSGLLLVTTRAAALPPLLGGKPAAVVSLLANALA